MTVRTAIYNPVTKSLTVYFTDGEKLRYANVDPPAYDALAAAGNYTSHWSKYIHPVYMEEPALA